mgnify:CR=1 FL=1
MSMRIRTARGIDDGAAGVFVGGDGGAGAGDDDRKPWERPGAPVSGGGVGGGGLFSSLIDAGSDASDWIKKILGL